jgi:hypothetical protein
MPHSQQEQLVFFGGIYLASSGREGAARGLGESLPGSEHDDYN